MAMKIKGYENKKFAEVLVDAATEMLEHAEGKRKLRMEIVEIEPIPEYEPKTIKALREKLLLPQGMFGSVVGVSGKTVEAWEAGTRKPSGTAMRVLAELDTNPEYLEKILHIKSAGV
jgi:putative transcriptional regulator